MTLNLSGEVNSQMFDKLLVEFNSLRGSEVLDVFFSTSEGGYTNAAIAISSFINRNKDKIKLIFYGEVFSAGMIIMLKSECSKEILEDTVGMYHFAWQNLSISEGGKPVDEYDKFVIDRLGKSKQETIKFLKTTKLNKKEIDAIAKGKDVYFTNERILQIING